jgi:hypothetical protein
MAAWGRRLAPLWIAWAWALTAVLVPHGTLAIHATPHAVVSLVGSDRTGSEQLVQEWAVAADTTDERLQRIVADVACQVYVTYAPATGSMLATVRVVGDNDLIIQHSVEVVASTAMAPAQLPGSKTPLMPHQLRIQRPKVTSAIRQDLHVQGSVRVEVIVHKYALIQNVQATGSGNVVVDDGVLAATDTSGNLTLQASGAGDLFLPPQLRVHVNELQLFSSGEGHLRLVASDVVVQQISASMGGTGGIQFAALTLRAAENITILSKGSGMVNWFFSSVKTAVLQVVTSGSGDVKLGRELPSGEDDVVSCEYRLAGSGNVHAKGLLCTKAQATVVGSGMIYTSARYVLACEVRGSGEVSAAVLSPTAEVSGQCEVRSRTEDGMPTATPVWADTYTLPRRETSFVVLTFEGEESGTDSTPTTTPLSSGAPFPWRPIVFLAVVIVAVALYRKATVARDRRRRPDETTPLVRDDDRVFI